MSCYDVASILAGMGVCDGEILTAPITSIREVQRNQSSPGANAVLEFQLTQGTPIDGRRDSGQVGTRLTTSGDDSAVLGSEILQDSQESCSRSVLAESCCSILAQKTALVDQLIEFAFSLNSLG